LWRHRVIDPDHAPAERARHASKVSDDSKKYVVITSSLVRPLVLFRLMPQSNAISVWEQLRDDPPLKLSAISSVTGVSHATLQRWARSGLLRTSKVGAHGLYRARRSDVLKLLNESRNDAEKM
jgi:Helix-turn-helix domain